MNVKVAIVIVAWCALAGAAAAQERPLLLPAPQGSRPAAAPAASAGTRDPGRPGAFEISASALWSGSSSIGSSDANLLSNNSSGTAYRLFTASGSFDAAVGFEARAGYHISRVFAVEGGLTFSRPTVSLTIANDVENGSGFTAPGETISQFFFDASLVVYPWARPRSGGWRPFAEVGAGYLTQLHGQSSAFSSYATKDTGQVYHVGGGARYFFGSRPSGALRALGLRFDARYYFRNGGFSFDGTHSQTFTAGAGLVIAF